MNPPAPIKLQPEQEENTVDQQTKAALKQDHFVTTTATGLEWAKENRKSVIVTTSLLLGAIILLVAIGMIYNARSSAAATAFGDAIQTYQAPLVTPGEPNAPGVKTFNSSAERAKAANAQFTAVADKYGMTSEGKNALYFAGITYKEIGQPQSAETAFKSVAGSWTNKELAALAKLALADLYHQTGRDPQAIDLYNELAAKPTDAVPAGSAQIQLAELYTTEGKIDQAHKIYAQLKDKDKDPKGAAGPSGRIAAQKLNPAAATPGLQ